MTNTETYRDITIGAAAKLPTLTCKAYKRDKLLIFVDHEPIGWHLSISHPTRYPTWDEIHDARYALVPDGVTMAMLLPPRAEYVNVHTNCFHLHEI